MMRLVVDLKEGGKSLAAKAIATALKSKSVAKSNQRTAVWVDEIDEIEKGNT